MKGSFQMTKREIDWKAEVEKIKDDLLTDLKSLIAIDSVRNDSLSDKEFPVGPGPAEALQHFLSIAERDGFATENFDNWAGHIDYGEGDDFLGILAHVDVVPAGSGWDTDPFDAIIKDNRLYGRGASDDKGPGIAAYYALKIVRELDLELSKKVRFIMGTDEESDWQCMDHYFDLNPQPLYGFSPDAHFPIINGEKGNISIYLSQAAESDLSGRRLISFQSGLKENMVPQDAEAHLSASESDDQDQVKEKYKQYLENESLDGQVEKVGEEWVFHLTGQASHGAQPEKGKNAGTYLASYLAGLDLQSDGKKYLTFIKDYLHDDPFAKKTNLNIDHEVMGDLTSNIGIMNYLEGESGTITINFRYPSDTDAQHIYQTFQELLKGQMDVSPGDAKEPHYVSADDPLVQTLLEVYEKQTGLEGYEVVIGGGTYARTIERGVAYGAMFPDSIDTMHQANEFIDLDDLFAATAIYAEAIYELAK